MRTPNLKKAFEIHSLNLNYVVALEGFGGLQEIPALFGPNSTDKLFLATGLVNQIATERLSRPGGLSKGHLGTYVLLVHHSDKIATNGTRASRATRPAVGLEIELKPHCSQLPSSVASQHQISGHLS